MIHSVIVIGKLINVVIDTRSLSGCALTWHSAISFGIRTYIGKNINPKTSV